MNTAPPSDDVCGCNERDSPQWDRSGLGPHGAVVELVAGHSNSKHADAVRVVRGKSAGIMFGGRAMPTVQGQQGGSQQPLGPVGCDREVPAWAAAAE